MMPSGARTPHGGTQPVVPSSLMRTNSGVLGSTGHAAGSLPGQQPFSSLVSPCIEFGSNSGGMGLLGNMSNVASLVTPLGNVMPGSSGAGFPSPSSSLQQRGGGADMMGGIEPDPLAFSSVHGTAQGQHFANGHTGNLATEKPQGQLLDGMQGFQQQFAMPQHSQPQTQLREGMGNASGVGAVKLEPLMGHGVVGPVKLESQMSHLDQNGPAQQLQALRTMSSVKMETQQLEPARTLGPVKLERQQLDSSMFFQQQQQQQLLMSRQSPQVTAAQMSPLQQQQRMLQLQQQQHHQQQILKTLSPQQRNQLQQQVQQCIPPRPQAKPVLYEPGTCARRLTYYMYHQQHRPEDNNIEFWRRFVSEFFAPNAKKRWCVSLYGSGRQTTGVFPQDAWHCEICNRKPGRGFETTFEVLPRLFQIKYASGTLEELLYVDMPREYKNASGHIVLDYAKAVQESVFEQLRVVREGQLRIVFSSDFKICSWEFCARQHEELIPRRLLIPQVSQLGAVMQKCQNATQHATSGLSSQDLQNTCSSFASSARQLAKSLEVPLVNDLGYTKRYVRCLQISEVVNSMKDLIDYSRETGTGPMDSLIKFPQKGAASSSLQCQQARRSEDQQTAAQSIVHNDQGASVAAGFQLTSVNNSVIRANNSVSNMPSSCTTTSTGLLHQNSMNSRQENQMSSVSSPYCGGNTAQIPSASSSNSIPPSQPNPSSPFPSPTLSTSNNTAATSHTAANLNSTSSPVNMPMMQQPSTEAQEADPSEPQSSVQQILKEMMMSSQLNTTMGNDMKCINGMAPTLNGVNCLVGNMTANGDPVNGMGYGRIGASGIGGLRAAMANSAMSMNGQVGMSHISRDPTGMNHPHHLQQEMANRLLSRLGPGNGFSNLQFDWKSP